MLQVLERIDRSNFGLIYEPANLLLCGEPYGEATIQRLQPHLMNVYVQNHRLDPEGPESCPPTVSVSGVSITWLCGSRVASISRPCSPDCGRWLTTATSPFIRRS